MWEPRGGWIESVGITFRLDFAMTSRQSAGFGLPTRGVRRYSGGRKNCKTHRIANTRGGGDARARIPRRSADGLHDSRPGRARAAAARRLCADDPLRISRGRSLCDRGRARRRRVVDAAQREMVARAYRSVGDASDPNRHWRRSVSALSRRGRARMAGARARHDQALAGTCSCSASSRAVNGADSVAR